MSEYTTVFTAGPLMSDTTAMIVEEVRQGTPLDEVDWEVIDINSWQGRHRKIAEIKRRLKNVNRGVGGSPRDLSTREKSLTLCYCCLKTYLPYYGKKHIYWLFQSPEGHFQVLVYMQRMDKYTPQRVRQDYLQRYQE